MLLGLLLLAVPAFSQDIDAVLNQMGDITSVEGPRLCSEICSYADQLNALEPEYKDSPAFQEMAFRRQRLRSEAEQRMKDFRLLSETLKKLGKAAQTDIAVLTFLPKRQGHKVKPALVQTYFQDRYQRDLGKRYQVCADAITKNDELFMSAALARKRKDTRIRIGLITAAALLFCAGVPIVLARRMAVRAVRQALTAAPAQQGPELLADNIRLERVIGEGGMGVVYEGTDLALDRKVAVKRMRDEVSGNPRGLDQFLAEARSVAALKHPNIVEIYSILKEQGRLYLVFEYVEGKTLEAALAANQKLTLEQALSVLRQAASALDYAHSRKVIHRDLKPSNIMITPAGTARLMDFGIAYQAKKTIAMLTKAEKWGTPAFMSPEQELGSIGNETDIYALGVCFYAMLTGTLPFPGPAHLAQKRAMSMAGAELLPQGFLPIMQKALAVDPRQRYHTSAELVSAVKSA